MSSYTKKPPIGGFFYGLRGWISLLVNDKIGLTNILRDIFRDSPPAGGQEAVDKMFSVYVLYNRVHKKIYIGQTANLEKRIAEHNQKRGNHFTARIDGDWILLYKENVADRKTAIIREKQLKSYKGREYLKKYIPR